MGLEEVKRQLETYDTATVYREDYKAFLAEYAQGKNVYVDGYGVCSADEVLSVIDRTAWVEAYPEVDMRLGTYLTIIPPLWD